MLRIVRLTSVLAALVATWIYALSRPLDKNLHSFVLLVREDSLIILTAALRCSVVAVSQAGSALKSSYLEAALSS